MAVNLKLRHLFGNKIVKIRIYGAACDLGSGTLERAGSGVALPDGGIGSGTTEQDGIRKRRARMAGACEKAGGAPQGGR